MSSVNKNSSKITGSESSKAGEKKSTTGKNNNLSNTNSTLASGSGNNISKSNQPFVPALSIYGKINNVLTNDPEGYYNKESDKVYELLSSSLEIYMRNIIQKMYENRNSRLQRVTKVVNGKPLKLSKINKVIETINKEDRKLELQRIKSRKENGIDIQGEDKENEETGDSSSQKQAVNKDVANIISSSSGDASSSPAASTNNKNITASDNNSTANLFSGGMNKKYSWLSGGSSFTNLKTNKSSSNISATGSLSGNPFANSETAPVQSDIRNHIIKEEKNLVMRDLIKVLEWELQNNSRGFSNKDILEILAKGYARLRD